MERCPYCFKPLEEGERCDCRYEESSRAKTVEALRPGTIVGACYLIGEVLGVGGFGITYRGFDLDMEKVVAVKEFFPSGMVIRYGMYSKPEEGRSARNNMVQTISPQKLEIFEKSLKLFYREAVALGKMSKMPNVVHAYRIFRENGTAYIVMDFVEGRSLKEILRERERIPEEELIPLLDPILEALGKVHQAGILHRDISPDNIIIDEEGQPVLLDFGAARIETDSKSSMIIGKKSYSPIEQMSGGVQDARSDIYALGATYYRVLSGKVPQASAERMVESDELLPLKELDPGISPQVSDAVEKAMALKPDDRWSSVEEFREALNRKPPEPPETLGSSEPSETTETTEPSETPVIPDRPVQPVQPVPPVPLRPPVIPIPRRLITTQKRRPKLLPWVIVAALLIAGGIFAYKMLSGNKAELSARATQEAEYAFMTETAEAVQRQTGTQEAAAATQTAEPMLQMEQTETRQARDTEEARLREQTETARFAEQTEKLIAAQTRAALDVQATQENIAQYTAEAAARQAEQRQTETRIALEVQGTQSALERQIGQAATRQAEQHREETRTVRDAQATKSVQERQTAQAAVRENRQHLAETEAVMKTQAVRTEIFEKETAEAPEMTRTVLTDAAEDLFAEMTGTAEPGKLTVEPTAFYLTQEAIEFEMTRMTGPDGAPTPTNRAGSGVEMTTISRTREAIEFEATRMTGPNGAPTPWNPLTPIVEMTAFYLTQEAIEFEMTGMTGPEKTPTPPGPGTPEPTAEPTAIFRTQEAVEFGMTGMTGPENTPTPPGPGTPEPTVTHLPTFRPLQPGDVLTFGRFEQDNDLTNGAEPVEWQVLTIDGSRALVISRFGLDAAAYDRSGEAVTWETCTLRQWLNGEFFSTVFDLSEQAVIAEVTLGNPDNPVSGADGGSDTKDRIFLLDMDEADRYFAGDPARQCAPTAYAAANGAFVNGSSGNSWWWLRSPGSSNFNAATVGTSGGISDIGDSVSFYTVVVRPALWLIL